MNESTGRCICIKEPQEGVERVHAGDEFTFKHSITTGQHKENLYYITGKDGRSQYVSKCHINRYFKITEEKHEFTKVKKY